MDKLSNAPKALLMVVITGVAALVIFIPYTLLQTKMQFSESFIWLAWVLFALAVGYAAQWLWSKRAEGEEGQTASKKGVKKPVMSIIIVIGLHLGVFLIWQAFFSKIFHYQFSHLIGVEILTLMAFLLSKSRQSVLAVVVVVIALIGFRSVAKEANAQSHIARVSDRAIGQVNVECPIIAKLRLPAKLDGSVAYQIQIPAGTWMTIMAHGDVTFDPALGWTGPEGYTDKLPRNMMGRDQMILQNDPFCGLMVSFDLSDHWEYVGRGKSIQVFETTTWVELYWNERQAPGCHLDNDGWADVIFRLPPGSIILSKLVAPTISPDDPMQPQCRNSCSAGRNIPPN